MTPYRCWLASDDESTAVEVIGVSPMHAAAVWAEQRSAAWAVVSVKELRGRYAGRVATYEVDSLGFSEEVKVAQQSESDGAEPEAARDQCDHGFPGSCHRCEAWQDRLANESEIVSLQGVLGRLVNAVRTGDDVAGAMFAAQTKLGGEW